MLVTVLLIVAFVVLVAAFGALYLWTRRSEADFDYDGGPGLTDEQANAARLGIALSSNASIMGGH